MYLISEYWRDSIAKRLELDGRHADAHVLRSLQPQDAELTRLQELLQGVTEVVRTDYEPAGSVRVPRILCNKECPEEKKGSDCGYAVSGFPSWLSGDKCPHFRAAVEGGE